MVSKSSTTVIYEMANVRAQGEISEKLGLVSAKVIDYAAALDTTPAAVLDALERTGIEPLVDTAEPKRTDSHDVRPEGPETRCLAFQTEDFRRLAAAVGAAEALEGEAMPATA